MLPYGSSYLTVTYFINSFDYPNLFSNLTQAPDNEQHRLIRPFKAYIRTRTLALRVLALESPIHKMKAVLGRPKGSHGPRRSLRRPRKMEMKYNSSCYHVLALR